MAEFCFVTPAWRHASLEPYVYMRIVLDKGDIKITILLVSCLKNNLDTQSNERSLTCLLFAYWVILYAFLSSADFFQNHFKKIFQEYHQSVKQLGSRCQA